MLVDFVAIFGVFAYRGKVPRFWVFAAMTGDSRYAKCRTVWACPYNVRETEFINDVHSGQCEDIDIQVDIVKTLIPLDAEDLVSRCLKSFSDAPCPGE